MILSLKIETLHAHDLSCEKISGLIHPLSECEIADENAHLLDCLAQFLDFQDHLDDDAFLEVWVPCLDREERLLAGPVVDDLVEVVIEALDGISLLVEHAALLLDLDQFYSFLLEIHACIPEVVGDFALQHVVALGWPKLDQD